VAPQHQTDGEEIPVALRMSTLLLRTLREDPAEAEVPSHRMLLRAGYVRRLAPGIYTYLPLGRLVLANIERIVREEMLAIGGQEVLFPAIIPREYFERSGRWTVYGDLLFKLQDRKGADFLLAPTHEELFTALVKGETSSYKDFPKIVFQIQTKYRDEARPRAGILRGREFMMKDSYSFDLDNAGLQVSYEKHRAAYIRIFDRLGLDYRIVAADSGAMGGSASEEFLGLAANGEDTFVTCENCDYAANVEAVTTVVPPLAASDDQPMVELDTPDTPTIESLVARVNELDLGRTYTAADTLKNIVVAVTEPAATESETVVIGLPGDREVDMKRLEAALGPAEVRLFEAEDFEKHPELVRGYIGPQSLAELGVRYLADPRVVDGSSWVTGANQEDVHVAHAVAGRDFTVDGHVEVADVRAGDACPMCGGELTIGRGIEIGHIFQLGTYHSDLFELDALGPEGKPIRVTMGSYGVGVSRAIGAIAEQTLDDAGLCWPRAIAPADVHVVATGKDDAIFDAAESMVAGLEAAGLRVLYDDRRGVSAGVKFNDSELIGVPTIAVVGRGLANGTIEVKDRRTGDRREVPTASAVDELVATCRP
jgi:prolyl-tRNA synthetase